MNYKMLIIVIIIIVTIVVSIKGSKTLGSFREGMFDKPYYKMDNCALTGYQIDMVHGSNIKEAERRCNSLSDCKAIEQHPNETTYSLKTFNANGHPIWHPNKIHNSQNFNMFIRADYKNNARNAADNQCKGRLTLQENKADNENIKKGVSVAGPDKSWWGMPNCDAPNIDIDKNGNEWANQSYPGTITKCVELCDNAKDDCLGFVYKTDRCWLKGTHAGDGGWVRKTDDNTKSFYIKGSMKKFAEDGKMFSTTCPSSNLKQWDSKSEKKITDASSIIKGDPDNNKIILIKSPKNNFEDDESEKQFVKNYVKTKMVKSLD